MGLIIRKFLMGFVLTFMLMPVVFANTEYKGTETVNINKANAETLAAYLKGVGPNKAEAIVKYRKANGTFKSVDDLKNVPGIGDETFKGNKRYISTSSGKSVAPKGYKMSEASGNSTSSKKKTTAKKSTSKKSSSSDSSSSLSSTKKSTSTKDVKGKTTTTAAKKKGEAKSTAAKKSATKKKTTAKKASTEKKPTAKKKSSSKKTTTAKVTKKKPVKKKATKKKTTKKKSS